MDISSKISKVKNYRKISDSEYQLQAAWTSSDMVEMNNGNSLEKELENLNTDIDNKLSALETNIDWKETVETYDDIATIYPNPEDGWTVNTKDNNITYRYNGSEWVAISANAIPKATNSVDGLLSKEDHAKYDDAVSKAHTHDNKSVLDGITSDKVTAWDTVNNKVDKVDGKGLSTNDYTTDEKNKLSGIADGANKTIVDSALDTSSENPVQNKVIAVEINTLKKSVSDGKTLVANAITEKGVDTAADATFAVMAENIGRIETGGGELHGAIISVSTEEETLIGKEVTLSKDEIIIDTKTFDENGVCSFTDILEIGVYVVSSTDGVEETASNVDITQDNIFNKTVVPCELSFLKIVTFADGTDAEIAKMIKAHYDNKINIADYWAVGDTRSVSLSAMSATGVGESHRAQTVQFVIGDFDHDDLTTPINGHTKAAVTLLQKDCLMDAANASNPVNGENNTENGYMNSSDTNVGGWKSCARRTWCNNVYLSALPSAWQSIVKTVNKKVSVGNNSSTIETVQDKIFLAAEIEIFGLNEYSFAGEGTQYQYYKNATANRYKMPKWSSSYVSHTYWERSPLSGYTAGFCVMYSADYAGASDASSAYGVAPCLCI